ncbi:MAG: hypothetical protein AAB759_03235, partial [Patescibacteria group bacterium]
TVFGYLALLSVIVIFAHILYFKVLEKTNERRRLVGLVGEHLGSRMTPTAIIAIIGGLLFALVAYLVLAGEFVRFIVPTAGGVGSVAVFWLAATLPILGSLGVLVGLELAIAVLMVVMILGIFLFGGDVASLARFDVVNFSRLLLPFGAVLFSLAGWTAVEPIFDYVWRKRKDGVYPVGGRPAEGAATTASGRSASNGVNLPVALATGTAIAAGLYALFVLGILTSAGVITPDTISGLTAWPFWKTALLGLLGIFAIWTSYVPIGLEIKDLLIQDLRWPRSAAAAFVVFAPPALVASGIGFLAAVGLAGGVFLSVQYLLILLVARRVLRPGRGTRLAIDVSVVAFIAAALYEIYYFLVR